jgi:hypothetical protein
MAMEGDGHINRNSVGRRNEGGKRKEEDYANWRVKERREAANL